MRSCTASAAAAFSYCASDVSRHSTSVRSSETDASAAPSAEKASAHTVEPWPSSVCAHCQSSAIGVYRRTVSSYDADASTSRDGCHATHLTSCVCWWSTAATSNASSSASQMYTALSRPHVASHRPVALQLTAFTSFSWPSSEATQSNSSSRHSQTAAVPSKLHDAMKRPHGDHAQHRIVR